MNQRLRMIRMGTSPSATVSSAFGATCHMCQNVRIETIDDLKSKKGYKWNHCNKMVRNDSHYDLTQRYRVCSAVWKYTVCSWIKNEFAFNFKIHGKRMSIVLQWKLGWNGQPKWTNYRCSEMRRIPFFSETGKSSHSIVKLQNSGNFLMVWLLWPFRWEWLREARIQGNGRKTDFNPRHKMTFWETYIRNKERGTLSTKERCTLISVEHKESSQSTEQLILQIKSKDDVKAASEAFKALVTEITRIQI